LAGYDAMATENSRKGPFYNEELIIINKTNFVGKESKLKKKEGQKFLEEYNKRVEKKSSKDNQRLVSTFGTQILTPVDEKPAKNFAKMLNNFTQIFNITDSEESDYNSLSNYIGIDNTEDEENLQNWGIKRTLNNQNKESKGDKINSPKKKVDHTKQPEGTTISNKTELSEIQDSDNLTPFIEELYFLNKSEIVVDEDDYGPPLEDSDIDFLPEEEKAYLARRQKIREEGNNNTQHQRLVSIFGMERSKKGQKNRQAVTNPSLKWGNCQVPYTIGKNFSPKDRGTIQGAMNQFAKETGINWVPRKAGNKDFVHIQQGSGCSSNVGKTGGRQTMNLGKISIKI
jgi:hypothetical protein